MTEILKITLTLTVTAVISAAIVSAVEFKTKDRIESAREQSEVKILKDIMPSDFSISEITGQCAECPQIYWIGSKGNDSVYVFEISEKGYSSYIDYLVCVDKVGKINNLIILNQNETPGLGAKIQEGNFRNYIWTSLKNKANRIPWFTEQFKGLNINKEITVDKISGDLNDANSATLHRSQSDNSITAITGATKTSIAVINGINTQARTFLKAIRG